MISEELLSEVLELKSGNVFIKEIETRNNDIEYLCNVGGWNLLNIYELAHKCKEWAFKNHKIIINSRITSKTKLINGYAEIIKNCNYLYGDYEDTEVEAIFKVCQYIMENKCGS